MKTTIGLFGTCGGSKWREPFMDAYNKLNISYYNPQVENWKPEDAVEEAEHLANDSIILFPVTSETYALGSLTEVGFSLLNAIKLDDRRDFVVMIENKLDDSLTDENLRKESLRARALAIQHLKKMKLSNLFLVPDLEKMLEVSITLYHAQKLVEPFKNYTL